MYIQRTHLLFVTAYYDLLVALDVAHLVLDGGREDVGVELLTIAPCMFPCSLIK